jgi:hypothetical protein
LFTKHGYRDQLVMHEGGEFDIKVHKII